MRKKIVNWERVTLAKRVKFDSKELKAFILDYCERSSFTKMLSDMKIELPTKLKNFNESEGSFETEQGLKITLDKANEKISVQDENEERTYIIEEGTDVILTNVRK